MRKVSVPQQGGESRGGPLTAVKGTEKKLFTTDKVVLQQLSTISNRPTGFRWGHSRVSASVLPAEKKIRTHYLCENRVDYPDSSAV